MDNVIYQFENKSNFFFISDVQAYRIYMFPFIYGWFITGFVCKHALHVLQVGRCQFVL